ncbi:thioredoxin reductase (NADPH) [Halopolyspora algeriensis]|uniref:Thioredoxin reductase (NADPH) n=1 Tax=Halopolyspora algeriensis TaxID=1500506 RepID=A0A368VFR1_9ACTN|nr:NAD(P)/FAD-dependent oxidoreductase [Halopolyspora algeriensis]RCW40063.1 thioredoxin reductase (NADPH) [Halopolyspora algeriensis]TQM56788.1 thioredoxin reductase (NADPH) [Halopolyspora algeriensis]
MEYDVVVVGGGSAGLAAGMMLGRSRRRVVVVDAGEPRNAPAEHLHGFLSRDGTSPAELLAVGREEVTRYEGEVLTGRVRGIEHGGEHGFVVRLADGGELTTRGVLVATGLRDELPAIPGLRERWGTDVLHCPYCHGYEVRDAPIAVVGGDNRPFTLHQAQLVRQWSDDVVFFPNRIDPTDEERERLAARGIGVVDGEVARLVTDEGRVSGVELADGRRVPRSAVFVGPRFVPHDELLTGLGCEVGENGWVTVDPSGRTSVPGVWAAGNVVDNPAQLINAAAAGATAAVALNHHLLAEDVDRAVAHHRAGDETLSRT